MAGTGNTDDPIVSDLCKFEELANKLPNMRNKKFVDEVMRRGRGGWGREGGEGWGREGGEGWRREEGGRGRRVLCFCPLVCC